MVHKSSYTCILVYNSAQTFSSRLVPFMLFLLDFTIFSFRFAFQYISFRCVSFLILVYFVAFRNVSFRFVRCVSISFRSLVQPVSSASSEQGFQSGPVPGTFTRLRSCIVPAEITEPPKISGGQNNNLAQVRWSIGLWNIFHKKLMITSIAEFSHSNRTIASRPS